MRILIDILGINKEKAKTLYSELVEKFDPNEHVFNLEEKAINLEFFNVDAFNGGAILVKIFRSKLINSFDISIGWSENGKTN